MKGWYAVFHKELSVYFLSPIAYAVIMAFTLIAGFFFWANISLLSVASMQAANTPGLVERINPTALVVRPLAQNMGIILLLLMPLLTMRLFSEEKRSGTIELLLTYPISDMGAMAGKYLAALVVLLVMLASTLPCMAILFSVSTPDVGTTISCYLGLFLMGASFIALGTFISTLTENQIVSGALTFGASLLVWVMSWSATFTGENLGTIIRRFSMLEHMQSFYKGVLTLPDVSFFVLFAIFFLFLTVRSLEVYRWRG